MKDGDTVEIQGRVYTYSSADNTFYPAGPIWPAK
jgi:hypothetical protein